jgi:hypothetical protein
LISHYWPGEAVRSPGNLIPLNREHYTMANYQAPPTPTAAEDPGRTLGIVGLVLSIVANVIGLIVSVIARNKSRAAGFDNGFAKAGIIVGIITTILAVLYLVFVVLIFGAALSHQGT